MLIDYLLCYFIFIYADTYADVYLGMVFIQFWYSCQLNDKLVTVSIVCSYNMKNITGRRLVLH